MIAASKRCVAVAVTSLTLACLTSAVGLPVATAQTQAPQLISSTPSNGVDLQAWPRETTLTFDQAITSASATLSGPQGVIKASNTQTTGSTFTAAFPQQQPSGRYVLTFTANKGDQTTTGSVAFTVKASANSDVAGAPSETGTASGSGVAWVIVGVSALGCAILLTFFTRRRVVTRRRAGVVQDPDHL